MRILSLLPSATEIVHALGAGEALVGRSAECDYPPSVAELPVVMRARFAPDAADSAAIDERVRSVRGSGASLYTLDLDRLRALAPDVILTQDLCGVCSVTEGEVAAACRASGLDPRIVALEPRRLEEVWASIETVGAAIDREEAAHRLASALRRRTGAPRARGGPSRVAVVEWLDPPILAGLWTPDLVRAAGGVAVGPAPGAPGERTRWEAIAAARPDLVVLAPCSFPVARTRSEIGALGLGTKLAALGAARGVHLADEAYFSRPGPRLADGVELLAARLRGDRTPGPMPAEPLATSAAPGAG